METLRRRWLAVVMLAGLVGTGHLALAEEEEAVTVFRLVAPRVVSLQNAEGSGTGIILRADGLILTNAHVVTSPLPYTVTVDVPAGDKTRPVTFKKVTVVGYHPTLDLALVKIDPKENNLTLQAVDLAKLKGTPGQRIYAIGNPAAGGKVLTKTITSGMLSAVDREVDGIPYYQIDAAVNPGNSGGPVCDKTGKVLGLVTFKFEDVAAISFAIPLQNLDVKAFVPLAERKGNPEKAQEYLKLAEHYGQLADEAARRQGLDSEDRLTFNYYSCLCYRMALVEDPSNPAIYYNVGCLLRTLDVDDVAAAYVARSIQLGPWDTTNGDPFRELGFSLVKQKDNAGAVAAWKEGVAKIPLAAKIWEDLAIYYIQHDQPEEAAYDAAMAVLIPNHEARKDVLNALVRDARKKLAPAALARLDERMERSHLIADLGRLIDASNKARKERQISMTPAFAPLLEKIGGPAIPGVQARIPQTPLQMPRELLIADKTPAPNTPPAPAIGITPRTPASPATPVTIDKPRPQPADPNDWIGPGTVKPAAPVVGDRSLAGKMRKVNGASCTPMLLEDVAAAAWSADGHYVFMLQTSGLLSKVSVPELKEVKHCTVPAKCVAMAASRLGLVVASPGTQELWLLNEDLETLKCIPVTEPREMGTARSLSEAFVSAGADRMQIVNLATAKCREFTVADLHEERRHPNFRLFVVSPDGKYIFCEGMNALHRLRIESDSLVYEAGGPEIGQNPKQVVISPDSRYVALPSGGGNSGIGVRSPYTTYVFKVNDLQNPMTTIDSGAYPQTLGFDAKAHAIYAQNHDTQLRVYNPQGELQADYKWKDYGGSPTQFLVHPDGKELFIETNHKWSWMELPDPARH